MMTTLQAASDTVFTDRSGDSLLDLTAQAGGFQWPILAVLLVGLLALALAAVRLGSDFLVARNLRRLHVPGSAAADLEALVITNPDSLYRRLLTGMLQVAACAPASLGQETRTVLDAFRVAYQRTQRLVSFLSSTAGGLGLLGTLVGIYALFSAGTRDAETIFAGIGIAIVSTLMGIVVSIILELLEAVVHSGLSRYLERAEEWATEVRYRLLQN